MERRPKGKNSGGPSGFRDFTTMITVDIGRGIFMGDEDEFYVWDMDPDGMRVGVEWKIASGSDSGRRGLCYNTRGEGPYAKCSKATHAGDVIMRLGRCDGTVNPCGKPGAGSGWRDWTGWFEGHNDAYNKVASQR